ncbi:MAG TPA: hypothetical protein VMY78_06740 [Solirubrobacteraceae bacterium]|nr:hypothetical protein [Solirubrobacteraceae bacterium]
MPFTLTPIAIDAELEFAERRPQLRDAEAIALMRSEFRRALNDLHFIALSADDPEIIIDARTVSRHGTTRYDLTLRFVPRVASATDDELAELVLSEFQRAVNASHFLRITGDTPVVTVISPAVSNGNARLRQAA